MRAFTANVASRGMLIGARGTLAVACPGAHSTSKMIVSPGQRYSSNFQIVMQALHALQATAPPPLRYSRGLGATSNGARRQSFTTVSMVRFKSSLAKGSLAAEGLQGYDELLKAGSEALQVHHVSCTKYQDPHIPTAQSLQNICMRVLHRGSVYD